MIAPAVVGVDPGTKGGIVVLDGAGAVALVEPIRPGMTKKQLVDICSRAARKAEGHAFMEKVGHMTGDGGLGSFTFGNVSGVLEGALLAFGLDVHYVYPTMWQAKLGCMSGGNKNVTKRRAAELFPKEKITHAVADALLIAQYGRERLAL